MLKNAKFYWIISLVLAAIYFMPIAKGRFPSTGVVMLIVSIMAALYFTFKNAKSDNSKH